MDENSRRYWELVKRFGIDQAEDLCGSEWAEKFVRSESPSDADEWQELERFLGYKVDYEMFLVASRVADAFSFSLLDL